MKTRSTSIVVPLVFGLVASACHGALHTGKGTVRDGGPGGSSDLGGRSSSTSGEAGGAGGVSTGGATAASGGSALGGSASGGNGAGGTGAAVGYRPYYQADIAGGFELFDRPDGTGKCLRQVVNPPAMSWAPETNPYSIIGDANWTYYEVSADVSIETTSGWASLMGRVSASGTGYGTYPGAYYMTLSPTGAWSFISSTTASATTTSIVSGQATLAAGTWHNVKRVFQSTAIAGAVDGTQVFSVTDSKYSKGNVGFGTAAKTTALFDNLIVNKVGGTTPAPTVFPQEGQSPPDGGAGGSTGSGGSTASGGASGSGGTTGSGGATRAGGNTGTGGATRSGAVTATGGTTRTAGTTAAGGIGATGGISAAGGTIRTGGTTATGGGIATGGIAATGGITTAGGITATGGTPATGGIAATGGTTGGTGNTGTGGTTGAAGTTGTAGSGGSGGQAGTRTTASSASGCSCSIGSANNNDRRVGLLLFAALGAIAMLRRRSNRASTRQGHPIS